MYTMSRYAVKTMYLKEARTTYNLECRGYSWSNRCSTKYEQELKTNFKTKVLQALSTKKEKETDVVQFKSGRTEFGVWTAIQVGF